VKPSSATLQTRGMTEGFKHDVVDNLKVLFFSLKQKHSQVLTSGFVVRALFLSLGIFSTALPQKLRLKAEG
jgi:hypothetical protein